MAFGGFGDKRAIPYALPNQDSRTYRTGSKYVFYTTHILTVCAVQICTVFVLVGHPYATDMYEACLSVLFPPLLAKSTKDLDLLSLLHCTLQLQCR